MSANQILGGLLALQAVLVIGAWWPRDAGVETRAVVPFPAEAIQKIQLESVSTRARGSDLVLARDGEGWVIQSAYGFPANPEPIEAILEPLLALRIGRPITEQAALHSKLNVAEDNFTRRVTLHIEGREPYEFLAGTATRERMNVRFPGEDAVYEAQGLGAWRMTDTITAYLPDRVLSVDPTKVTSFQLTNERGSLDLTRTPDDGWTLPDGPVDTLATRRLLSAALALDVGRPTDPAMPDPRVDPLLTVRWSLEDGTTGHYEGAMHAADLAIRLGDDTLPVFLVDGATVRPKLLDTTVATLRPSGEDPDEEF